MNPFPPGEGRVRGVAERTVGTLTPSLSWREWEGGGGGKRIMPHPAISLVAERVEAILDELAIALQCRLVGIRRHLDRLAPEMQSFGEGKGEVEAVPSSHHPPPPRRIGERDDRHLGEARRRDDALARLHRRTARPVRRDADAVAVLELLDHRAQRRQAAPRAR